MELIFLQVCLFLYALAIILRIAVHCISNYIVTEGFDKILSKQFTDTYFACLKRVTELTLLKYTRSFVDI